MSVTHNLFRAQKARSHRNRIQKPGPWRDIFRSIDEPKRNRRCHVQRAQPMNRSECRSETQLSRASNRVKFPNALGRGPQRPRVATKVVSKISSYGHDRPGAEISGIIFHPHFVIFHSWRSISFLLEIGRHVTPRRTEP